MREFGACLSVNNLTVSFPNEQDPKKKDVVVDHISFDVPKSSIVGIVGESGSGKSMTALAAMGLLSERASIDSGEILLEGNNIFAMTEKEKCKVRGDDISMIFQEPMTSLDPVMKIGKQVEEVLKLHTDMSKKERFEAAKNALVSVGLENAEQIMNKYPHELSGGMRQRVMIAQATLCTPKLLIADEPTTALDVVVQNQILELLMKIRKEQGLSILFISHDLAVIRKICTDVIVMYQGRIVESGKTGDIFMHPKHEYTKTLIARIPYHRSDRIGETILSMENVSIYYEDRKSLLSRGKKEKIVSNLSFTMREGEILGIVGESGSGKSTIAKVICGLNPLYEGKLRMIKDADPQMVFQDPQSSLNPSRTIGWSLTEALHSTKIKSSKAKKRRVLEVLKDVGLPESAYDRYPGELSGGQRQRVSIGLSLMSDTKLLIADEAVSALDVTIQSKILSLLLDIHRQRNLAILFITHDLGIVKGICDRVLVMKDGEMVEEGSADRICGSPKEEYTKTLIKASLI